MNRKIELGVLAGAALNLLCAVTLLVAAVGLPACATTYLPKRLAQTEIGLTAAIEAGDQVLNLNCPSGDKEALRSDKCGKTLAWHEKFGSAAKIGQSGLLTARAYIAKDPGLVERVIKGIQDNIGTLQDLLKKGV